MQTQFSQTNIIPNTISPTADSRSVSIIIPCFNESEGIESLSTKLLPVWQQLNLIRKTELIFVDDGSTDDTFAQIQHFFGEQAQIVRHPKNKGLSAAIHTGFIHSRGDIICTIDSDCTYNPQYLLPLLNLMNRADVVTASPYHPKGSVKNVPPWRLFLSKGLSQIYRIVLPQKLYTYTSMFRAYRREVLEIIPITYPGFLGLVEILVEAMLHGYKVAEYPAELQSRVYGQSKLRVARVILSHLRYLAQLIKRRTVKTKKALVYK
ncbi:glycosyltransferase [Gloeocapsa sp. BRSZ]